MIWLIAAGAGGIGLVLALLRLFAGPTHYDRILAANVAMVMLLTISAAGAVASDRADWLGVSFALAFALIIANVALLKFFSLNSFQPRIAPEDGEA
ncbi:MAG: hypothetical protein R3C25_09605 [Hyphomonadaceae bacterium]